jgi:hypothetical protein
VHRRRHGDLNGHRGDVAPHSSKWPASELENIGHGGLFVELLLSLSELGLGEGDAAEAPHELGEAAGRVGRDAGLGVEALDDGLVEALPVAGCS